MKYSFLLLVVLITLSSCHLRKRAVVNDNAEQNTVTLEKEIASWVGVQYKYGGNDKQGIDCSGLVFQIYAKVYHKNVPRTSRLQFERCKKISIKELSKGDLLFFDMEGKGVSHVGIYLGNNQFVHASSSKGVVIVELSNAYFQKKLVGCGRF